MKRTWLVLMALLLLATSAAVQAQFDYMTNPDGISVTITNYSGPGNVAVDIPSTLDGLSVTGIGSDAFLGSSITGAIIPDSVTSIQSDAFEFCANLTNVVIGDSVTSIGDYAFGYCTSLHRVTVPDSVTSVGDYAFEDCTGLDSVTISSSVTNIGYRTFDSCTNLVAIVMEAGNPDYSSVDGVLFNENETSLIQ